MCDLKFCLIFHSVYIHEQICVLTFEVCDDCDAGMEGWFVVDVAICDAGMKFVVDDISTFYG